MCEPRDQLPLKKKTFIGPWKDLAEFQKVYTFLFGENATAETESFALKEMQLWHLRRGSLCPAAVLATYSIKRVQLQEKNKNLSDLDLQELYAFALIRFFNFMSSTLQTHSMKTMYDIAQDLGLNSCVVDIRHICAHNAVLPELQMLRNTATYCLRWIHDYYWKPLNQNISNVTSSTMVLKDKNRIEYRINELFGIYDTSLQCYMCSAHNIKTAKRFIHGEEFKNFRDYYKKTEVNSIDVGLEHIVKDLISIIKEFITMRNIQEIITEAIMDMKFFHNLLPTNDKNTMRLIRATQSFFRMLAAYGLLETYYHGLFDIAENNNLPTSKRANAGFWLHQITNGFIAFQKCKKMFKVELDKNQNFKVNFPSLNEHTICKNVRKLLIYAGVNMQTTLLFGDSYDKPWIWVFNRNFLIGRLEAINEYTIPIIKNFLCLIRPQLNIEETEGIKELVDSFFTNKTLDELNSKLFSLEDLVAKSLLDSNILEEVNNTSNCQNENLFGCWKLDDENNDWSVKALGQLNWE